MNFNYKKILFTIFIIISCKQLCSQNYDSLKYSTDEILVFSNNIITNKFDSPTKIQIITRNEIENKNGETLSDIINLAGNVFVKSYGSSLSLSTISLNGLGAEHTLVLLNGFKLNSSQNAQLDLSNVSKNNIERIEVLNNGSSAVYGSEAIGGVVNIITTKNLSNKINLKLKGQIGSYQQKKFSIVLNKKFDKLNLNINYSKETALNNYEYYFNNGIEKILKQRQNSNYDVSDYFLSLDYFINNNSKLNLYSNYSNQFRNIPGIETGSAPSKSNQSDKLWNNILSLESFFSKNLSFKYQVNFQNNLSNYDNINLTNSFYKNIYLSNNGQINFAKENFKINCGFEVSYASLKSNAVENDARRIQVSLYSVSEIKLNGLLRIFPSMRYDHISDINKNVFSGKLGFNVKPFKNYRLSFKAGIGNNFSSPTFNELYWKDLGNRNLKPEKSTNFDVGVIFNTKLLCEQTVEATYTYIDAKDKIVWSPNSNGLWSPKNIGNSVSQVLSLDLNVNKDFSKSFILNFNLKYSYTSSLQKSRDFPDDKSYNKQIFYIPKELFKSNLEVIYKNTGINLFYTFTGKRYTDFENINFLPAIDLLEGNVYQNFKISKINLQLKFEINNILNSDYQIISGYPMPLRNYKLLLSIEY